MTPSVATFTPALQPATQVALVDALVEQGWYVGREVIDLELCEALNHELLHRAAYNGLDEAGIGRGQQHLLRKDIRGDAIHWLDRESAAQRRYLDAMRELQQALNHALFLGYLTPDWRSDGGGEMVIYHPDDPSQEVARVIPEAGTFACFLSETIPHEVLPTRCPRTSIAGWFRRNASLGGVLDPAR